MSNFLKALLILEPLIEEVVAYVSGGPKPHFFDTLPEPLRSRVAFDALKGRST